MPVNLPQKQPDPIRAVLPMVGSAVGGIFGGPGGAMAGGKIGEAVAGQGPTPNRVTSKAPDNAMQRRMDQQPPAAALNQADIALQQLPPEYEQQYGATIRRAQMLEQQRNMA
jgi:hypothetical protein